MKSTIEKIIFPEQDVVDLTVYQFKKPIKLKSYRFSVTINQKPRGIVFYIHGYGSYANADACLAKELAE